ncbi:hypothetical protein PFISCL1PPCAC_2897, partial [Pristionchus fissidentatus]
IRISTSSISDPMKLLLFFSLFSLVSSIKWGKFEDLFNLLSVDATRATFVFADAAKKLEMTTEDFVKECDATFTDFWPSNATLESLIGFYNEKLRPAKTFNTVQEVVDLMKGSAPLAYEFVQEANDKMEKKLVKLSPETQSFVAMLREQASEFVLYAIAEPTGASNGEYYQKLFMKFM